MRSHAPFILRIAAEVDIAQAAVEIAAALEEHHRKTEQEAGKRIAGRKRRKDEESVRRNSLRHVDLVAPEFDAGLQTVAAGGKRKTVSRFIRVLRRVARSGDGIPNAGIAAHDEERRTLRRRQRAVDS